MKPKTKQNPTEENENELQYHQENHQWTLPASQTKQLAKQQSCDASYVVYALDGKDLSNQLTWNQKALKPFAQGIGIKQSCDASYVVYALDGKDLSNQLTWNQKAPKPFVQGIGIKRNIKE
eukprot:115586_1